MRFALVSALLIGAAVAGGVAPPAGSTVTSTAVATITSCPPDTPDCPAATQVTDRLADKPIISVIAISTTGSPANETTAPPQQSGSEAPPKPSQPSSPEKPSKPSSPEQAPPVTVTVTVTAPCETKPGVPGKPTKPTPSGTGTGYYPTGPSKPVYPTGSGAPPKPTSPPKFTGAANSVTGGAFVAGVGAFAAFFL
ncbi:hypothetical protein P152DRAFT_470574 [Eremomyces bilateralis CBS 781.70]|uniref:GPI anchored serine-rich protein n=1 Tax=Eremomyces bilateralis CBS 781.70 TaxID=1392243 RepID=A0A6G1GER3_9PEZI|nr:uncharacterized protein P152DRAFT_470574 [Eremomyces bilateralis CBS 781.70]KAF1816567.1 hypothetical protein P152DRAFT_470574 [Eremomyces bilateralis CBS 781.70]